MYRIAITYCNKDLEFRTNLSTDAESEKYKKQTFDITDIKIVFEKAEEKNDNFNMEFIDRVDGNYDEDSDYGDDY